jgi:lipopolysaccharide/colanic/teichoic acid biosynthesis glycosyltransferase
MADNLSMFPSVTGGADHNVSVPEQFRHSLGSMGRGRLVGQWPVQALACVVLVALMPLLIYFGGDLDAALEPVQSINTTAGTLGALAIALYLFRRFSAFPGIGVASHVLPAVCAGFGLVLAIFFGLRLDYSRVLFGMSFASAALLFFVFSAYARHRAAHRFYIVPSESTARLPHYGHAEWITLRSPELPDDPDAVLIADLRADLSHDWERLIAQAALAGRPVYHVKQVEESITGRVTIDHLSENSFGSLVPNLSYRKLKRTIDLVAALLLIPILVVPIAAIAVMIRLESPGPAFFRQRRRGYRGVTFEIVKFRTMTHRPHDEADALRGAITLDNDKRITRIGRFLRRTRIDELPQIWNILKGEMSWIGPRPEAMKLSEWYEAELPFYSYRHIVRPGLTGWAQVNQGHVAELASVQQKLQYDFFYIKNFSAWLDLIIAARTVYIVLSGAGAK